MTPNVNPVPLFIFPGQGSQYVGMGSDLYEAYPCAREVYERASNTLQFDVAELSFQGPADRLHQTDCTQVALLTHSVACLQVFNELSANALTPAMTAGHSLGEYTALVAAGTLSFEDALRLVHTRGRLMAEFGRGQMAAFRLGLELIKPLADARYCGIGGCNLPEQTVVCGLEQDLAMLMDDVRQQHGANRSGRLLKTAGAFHTYLMIGAAERFRSTLEHIQLHPPTAEVLSNYTGNFHGADPDMIRAALFFQMFNPVRWMLGLQRAIGAGANVVIEFGGGIGRDAPGSTQLPSSRKPNLEGITRRSWAGGAHHALYFPAINLTGIEQAARQAQIIGAATRSATSATTALPVNANHAVDASHLRVLVPARNGMLVSESALEVIALLEQLELDAFVPVIIEDEAENLAMLNHLSETPVTKAEPYLELIVAGSTCALLYFLGADIRDELMALRSRLNRSSAELANHQS